MGVSVCLSGSVGVGVCGRSCVRALVGVCVNVWVCAGTCVWMYVWVLFAYVCWMYLHKYACMYANDFCGPENFLMSALLQVYSCMSPCRTVCLMCVMCVLCADHVDSIAYQRYSRDSPTTILLRRPSLMCDVQPCAVLGDIFRMQFTRKQQLVQETMIRRSSPMNRDI